MILRILLKKIVCKKSFSTDLFLSSYPLFSSYLRKRFHKPFEEACFFFWMDISQKYPVALQIHIEFVCRTCAPPATVSSMQDVRRVNDLERNESRLMHSLRLAWSVACLARAPTASATLRQWHYQFLSFSYVVYNYYMRRSLYLFVR